MSPQLGLLAYALFALVLLYLDKRRRSGISPALWLVVLWVAIAGSRPVSAWLNLGGGGDLSDNEMEGNSIDRNVSLFLILAGLYVLWQRNVRWRWFFANNRWLSLFYLFCGISVVWSVEPFVAFKRWFRETGNLVMVLVILSEANPVAAMQAVFARCACLLIPLSVVFIKYYQNLGRGYSAVTGAVHYNGVALGKNQLGATLLLLALFLIWELIQLIQNGVRPGRKAAILGHLALLAMALWLLRIANSATSVACMALGAFLLVALALEVVRRQVARLFTYAAISAVLLLLVSSVVDLKKEVTTSLGRDPTLHGRNDIWTSVLAEGTNPIIGTGFYSFWLGSRSEKLSQKNGFHWRVNQAHNGYIEAYLNGGVIGLGLLLAALVAAGKRIKEQLMVDTWQASVKLAVWLSVMFHNWSEASICRPGPLWFTLLLVIVDYPPLQQEALTREQPRAGSYSPQREGQAIVS